MNARRVQLILIATMLFSSFLGVASPRQIPTYNLVQMDYGCSQDAREQLQLFDEAEADEYTVRRIEFSGNATIRHDVLARRVLFEEGDIFSRKSLERSVKNLSKLKVIERVRLSDVEVRLDRENEHIDFLFCVKERRRAH